MPQFAGQSNSPNYGMHYTTAPLTNVSLCSKALMRAVERPLHLPGFVCFYGPAGWGKSTAAAYVQNTQDAYLIQCQKSWTQKAVLEAILDQMGISPARTLYQMSNQVCKQLANSQRPLIVDEFDYLVEKKSVELIRDIHDGSQAAILLIGEEYLPTKLERWERFHRRVLDWVPAQPTDLDDTKHLVSLYARGVVIAEDLISAMHTACNGSASRVALNIELICDTAGNIGATEMDMNTWGKREFNTGRTPERRKYR
jgi:AAA domain